MDTSVSLTIIGIAMILVGVIFNAFPKLVNKRVMGDMEEVAVKPAASLRTIIGASAITVGVTSLYCRNFPEEHAIVVLTALGIGFIILLATIILTKIRGFSDHIPIPPIVMFIILTIIAFAGSL